SPPPGSAEATDPRHRARCAAPLRHGVIIESTGAPAVTAVTVPRPAARRGRGTLPSGPPRHGERAMIVNLYRHRGYIWRTAWADVRHRHVGSAMGAVWNILQPLSMIAVYAVIFTSVFRRQDNYLLYLCSAALPWAGFSECVSRGTNAFT